MTPTEATATALRRVASRYLDDGIDVHTLIGNAFNKVADEMENIANQHPELNVRRFGDR